MTIGALATVETGSDCVGPVAVVVMGPAGTGKTTTARLLSARLGWEFAEGDRFHPQVNVDKMTRGVPLDDADRAPWLAGIRDWISAQADSGHGVVVTCSALKRSYRDILRQATADVRFVQLLADEKLAAARMASRSGHFMPPALLSSQYAALEALQPDESGVRVEADQPPDTVVSQALTLLGLGTA
jgi:gluconokinase